MTAEQLMESHRYIAASHETVTCCCCGSTTNAAGAECSRCRVPLAVSQSSKSRGVAPQFIPVLGGSGAGKTVYLGMLLDILSKRSDGIIGQPNNAFLGLCTAASGGVSRASPFSPKRPSANRKNGIGSTVKCDLQIGR